MGRLRVGDGGQVRGVDGHLDLEVDEPAADGAKDTQRELAVRALGELYAAERAEVDVSSDRLQIRRHLDDGSGHGRRRRAARQCAAHGDTGMVVLEQGDGAAAVDADGGGLCAREVHHLGELDPARQHAHTVEAGAVGEVDARGGRARATTEQHERLLRAEADAKVERGHSHQRVDAAVVHHGQRDARCRPVEIDGDEGRAGRHRSHPAPLDRQRGGARRGEAAGGTDVVLGAVCEGGRRMRQRMVVAVGALHARELRPAHETVARRVRPRSEAEGHGADRDDRDGGGVGEVEGWRGHGRRHRQRRALGATAHMEHGRVDVRTPHFGDGDIGARVEPKVDRVRYALEDDGHPHRRLRGDADGRLGGGVLGRAEAELVERESHRQRWGQLDRDREHPLSGRLPADQPLHLRHVRTVRVRIDCDCAPPVPRGRLFRRRLRVRRHDAERRVDACHIELGGIDNLELQIGEPQLGIDAPRVAFELCTQWQHVHTHTATRGTTHAHEEHTATKGTAHAHREHTASDHTHRAPYQATAAPRSRHGPSRLQSSAPWWRRTWKV